MLYIELYNNSSIISVHLYIHMVTCIQVITIQVYNHILSSISPISKKNTALFDLRVAVLIDILYFRTRILEKLTLFLLLCSDENNGSNNHNKSIAFSFSKIKITFTLYVLNEIVSSRIETAYLCLKTQAFHHNPGKSRLCASFLHSFKIE